MPRIQITNSGLESPMSSLGTVVKLDGREVGHVRRVAIVADVHDAISAHLDMFVSEDIDVDVGAHVTISIVPQDGMEVEETPLPDGGKRLRVTLLKVDRG